MRPILMIMCDKTSFISTNNHQKTKEVEYFDFLAHGISFNQKVKHYIKEQVKFKNIPDIS